MMNEHFDGFFQYERTIVVALLVEQAASGIFIARYACITFRVR
jgi:hypothetical protein